MLKFILDIVLVGKTYDTIKGIWQVEFSGLNWTALIATATELLSLPPLDRARVVGGLPDVVTIQEGKVMFVMLSLSSPSHT